MKRKTDSASLKAKAVLEAIRGQRTLNEIASSYGVHPNQLGQWKKQALEALPDIFSNGRARSQAGEEALRDQLYQQIGQLKVELDWLKKRPVSAIEEALTFGQPELFNTDQGVQFTSNSFTSVLEDHGISISMDGRGRALDNVFAERLWRSVKYEEVYLHDYQTPVEAQLGLDRYFRFYNKERFHQSLGYRTPGEVYGVCENGFSRHKEVYPPMGVTRGEWAQGTESPRPSHRLDEPPSVYPSAGCSPAEPASVSTDIGNIVNVS